eukprot:3257964-Pleurochrysis_carterae.AAC.3
MSWPGCHCIAFSSIQTIETSIQTIETHRRKLGLPSISAALVPSRQFIRLHRDTETRPLYSYFRPYKSGMGCHKTSPSISFDAWLTSLHLTN